MSPPKKIVYEYFPEAWIALNREASKHPELLAFLTEADTTDFADILGAVAAYLGMEIDKEFLPGELEGFCKDLTRRLYEMRRIIVH